MMIRTIKTVFAKELVDLFRDWRTLLTGIIIPVVLFPLILLYLNIIVNKSRTDVEKELKIAVSGKRSSYTEFLKGRKNIKIYKSRDLKEDLISGKVYAGLIIPENFDRDISESRKVVIEVIIDNRSQLSLVAYSKIAELTSAYSGRVIRGRFGNRSETMKLNPVGVKSVLVEPEERGAGMLLLSIILPLMLLTYSVISPLSVAADLGAGEKERGTLEHLLCTRAGRFEILCGKFAAVSVFGVIGVLSFLAGVAISFIVTPDFFGESGYTLALNPVSLLLISLLTLGLIMVFGALLLGVSFFSRSTREAQTLSLPLILISMASGYGTNMIDIKNYPAIFLHLPLLNISIVIKELILETFSAMNILTVFAWTLLYLAAALFAAGKIFSRERVIFRN
jgi:sodium transport system permease protein